MHFAQRSIFALLLLCFVEACSASQDSAAVAQLRWLEHADPIVDATTALAAKDHRLVGVYGFHFAVPGVDLSQEQSFKERYGVRPLEGTSDSLEGEEHARLVRIAEQLS